MQINEVNDLQIHRRHLHNAMVLLMSREADWTGADRVRGDATMVNLQKQISEIDKRGRK